MRPAEPRLVLILLLLWVNVPLHAQTDEDSSMEMLREAAVAAYSPLISPE